MTEVELHGPRVRTRSGAGLVAAAVAGLGVAIVSIWMCGEELAAGALVEVLTDYRLDPIAAFIVFPSRRRPSQKARAFSDYLASALEKVDRLPAPAGESGTSATG